MAKRLYSYSHDSEEQAEDIRNLLSANNIAFYETPASRWGFSNAAIWISHDEDFDKAKELFEVEVIEYAQRARQKFEEETGYNPNATGTERLAFTLRYLFIRKAAIPLFIVGMSLVGLYFYLFFKMFL